MFPEIHIGRGGCDIREIRFGDCAKEIPWVLVPLSVKPLEVIPVPASVVST